MMTYYLLRGGATLSRLLPTVWLYRLATAVASVVAICPTSARDSARDNIAHVLRQPSASTRVRHAAVSAMRCQALNYVDLLRMDRVTSDEIDATVTHDGLKPLTDAVAAGQGVILISAHVGNLDYAAQWLAFHGIQVHTLMERLKPEQLYQWVRRQRGRGGLHIHPVAPDALGELTRFVREGSVVALVADRDVTGAGQSVDFFGAPASLPIGPALLALRTGAPVIAAFGRRLHHNHVHVSLLPPVQLRRTKNLRADLRDGMKVIAQLLEQGIAAAPDQWIVFEPIWPPTSVQHGKGTAA